VSVGPWWTTLRRRPAPATPVVAGLPANGAELLKRLVTKDEALARDALCQAGELVKHVKLKGAAAGYGDDMNHWPTAGVQLAIDEVRAFEARARQAPTPKPALPPPAPAAYIGYERAMSLEKRLKDLSPDLLPKFLRYYKIQHIMGLPASQYADAIARVKAEEDRLAATATEQMDGET